MVLFCQIKLFNKEIYIIYIICHLCHTSFHLYELYLSHAYSSRPFIQTGFKFHLNLCYTNFQKRNFFCRSLKSRDIIFCYTKKISHIKMINIDSTLKKHYSQYIGIINPAKCTPPYEEYVYCSSRR